MVQMEMAGAEGPRPSLHLCALCILLQAAPPCTVYLRPRTEGAARSDLRRLPCQVLAGPAKSSVPSRVGGSWPATSLSPGLSTASHCPLAGESGPEEDRTARQVAVSRLGRPEEGTKSSRRETVPAPRPPLRLPPTTSSKGRIGRGHGKNCRGPTPLRMGQGRAWCAPAGPG